MTDTDTGMGSRDGTDELAFEDERSSARSKWVAGALFLALVAWMGSGFILPSEDPATSDDLPDPSAPVVVAYQASEAEEITVYFTAEGQAQPDRLTVIRAETTGEVAEVLARNGDMLEAGEVIARLVATRQTASLNQAREELARAERDFENAETLLERGATSADRLSNARAALAAARAQLTTAEDALDDTVIRAPFEGRLDELEIDEGEFVQAGAAVATIIDSDPLTVVIRVPQQALASVVEGQTAEVTFITGARREGRVEFVGINADAATRTFRVEVTVPNEGGELPSGLSAQVRIPTGTASAHFLSPAILSLSPDGLLGVKTVDANDIVDFYPVEIQRAQTDGVWVSGLPDEARIITIGQGYVSSGEEVDPRPEADADGLDRQVTDAPRAAETAGEGLQ